MLRTSNCSRICSTWIPLTRGWSGSSTRRSTRSTRRTCRTRPRGTSVWIIQIKTTRAKVKISITLTKPKPRVSVVVSLLWAIRTHLEGEICCHSTLPIPIMGVWGWMDNLLPLSSNSNSHHFQIWTLTVVNVLCLINETKLTNNS